MAKFKRRSISLFAKLRNYYITGIVVLIPIGIKIYLTKLKLKSNNLSHNPSGNKLLSKR